jgi:hypothetical protein
LKRQQRLCASAASQSRAALQEEHKKVFTLRAVSCEEISSRVWTPSGVSCCAFWQTSGSFWDVDFF